MTWVQDGIFAGGGEALPENWEAFAAQTGVTAVLHLRAGSPAAFRGPSPASFLWMGLASEAEAALPERIAVATFIDDCLRRGERVLLHAAHGRHRTRWAFVAYRIWSGAGAGRALRQAAEPPWMAPYLTDRDRWIQFDRLAHRARLQPQESSDL